MTPLETEPNLDHYRNPLSIRRVKAKMRPCLKQLRGVQLSQDQSVSSYSGVGSEKKDREKLGWIEGVLIRCVLNITGVMLYLRISWVVGQAGLLLGSLVIFLCASIVFITSFSMSAICTNGKVRAGGAYFIISRSLGPDFGGSIGIIFSLANAVSAAVYLAGFADTVLTVMQEHDIKIVDGSINDVRIIGWIASLFLLAIVCAGLSFESKAQIVLLVVLVFSLITYFIGLFIPPSEEQRSKGITGFDFETLKQNLMPDWRGETFFSVLAVYFPAATGFLAGANISGDLKEPEKAIPKGTILGIALTSALYLSVLWATGTTCIRDASGRIEDLQNGSIMNCVETNSCEYGLHNYFHILEIEGAFKSIITAGVFSATLSSALASTVSAPKVLQVVARDRLFPYMGYFAKGSKRSDEPLRGYLLTFVITITVIAIGDINRIAPLISNFFMASYALINYACFDASFAQSPGFRPTFKFYNMWLSLLGAFLCIVMMFFISWINALVTVIFIMLLYVYLIRKRPDVNWGDSTQANTYKSAVRNMLKLQVIQDHVKTYRPMVLVLTGNPSERLWLVDFVSNITKRQGLLICGHVLMSTTLTEKLLQAKHDFSKKIILWFRKRHIRAFYYSYLANNIKDGVLALLQLSGMGKLTPNIVIVGFKTDWETLDTYDVDEYYHILQYGFDFNKAVGIFRLPREQVSVVSDIIPTTSACVENEAQPLHYIPTRSIRKPVRSQSVESFSIFARQHQPIVQQRARRYTSAYEDSDQAEAYDQPNQDNMNHYPAHEDAYTSIDSDASDDKDEFQINVDDAKPTLRNSCFAKLLRLTRKMNSDVEIKEKLRMDDFQTKVKSATIDLWWLFDDGGLSVLIPHLLTQAGYLEGAKLRVFTIVRKADEFNDEQSKMVFLLNQLRIPFKDVRVFSEDEIEDKECTTKLFNDLIEKFKVPKQVQKENGEDVTASFTIDDEKLSNFQLTNARLTKARNAMLQYSMDANLIIVTIPVPRKQSLPGSLYMTWLDILSRDLPPTLLLRGNQEPVLTFYS